MGAMRTTPPQILASGRFLSLVKRGTWEYATRATSPDVVAIVPITDDGRILLVEQFRPPIGAKVIEIPAGLVGDHEHHVGETAETAARRELLEETGHQAASWSLLAAGPTSPGICDEVMSLFLATDLRRVGPAHGDGNEQIELHEVHLRDLHPWLAGRAGGGTVIDIKIFSGLYLAARANPGLRAALYTP